MTISNNYIFLRKPQTKEIKKVNNNDENVIVVDVGQSVASSIEKIFPDALKAEADARERFVSKYNYSVESGTNAYQIEFIVMEVVNSTYLTVTAEGKTKAKIISVLESVHELIANSNEFDDYICVVSYDSISEYYCNKMYPKLNELERNLRRLLFNIYIANLGLDYYETTISGEYQDKAKSIIQAKGGKQKKRETYIQQFFYAFTYDEIHKVLFTPHWSKLEENAKQRFLEEHSDLSKLTDGQLREAFSTFKPKSDWERFFSSKVIIDDIEKVLDSIREHRNNVAHCKFFYNVQYTECVKLTRKFNTAIVNAIKITEEMDFADKNSESISKVLKSLAETMKDFYSKVMPQLTTTAKSFAEVITKISINPSITSNLVNIVKVYRDAFCIMTQADDGNSDRQLEFDGENNEDINQQ